MEKPGRYTASLSQSQGRTGWSIIFRHPARKDDSGKVGLRVRQGLATRDKTEAERFQKEMNQLLADPRYCDPASRADAERKFDPRVVDIFFHKMLPEEMDFVAIRDQAIPLPSSLDSSYRRVLLLGTTGAGKTTLVRQLIGTDPETERFPSTSTAKTTVHDTEIVLRDSGPYRAVVTFVTADEVREYLKECISAAVLAAYRDADDGEVLRRLLAHVNQRFRFNYVLGNGPAVSSGDFDDEDDDAGDEIEMSAEGTSAMDLAATNDLLNRAIREIREIAQRHGKQLRQVLDASGEADQRVVDELFEEELDNLIRDDDGFDELADALFDEIEKRFNLLPEGEERRTKQGWPLSWQCEREDRASFVRAVTRFSSNYAPLFGQLLGPLVNGIRVEGPFQPEWLNGTTTKLVILDGEGLGHTPTSVAAISTSVIRRIGEADAVILVDNAAQPMQAAPVAAMRELVTTGNASKLLVAFTHFDAVKGDNLATVSARVHHVLESAENVLAAVGEELGPFAERALRKRLADARFFLENIQEPLSTKTKSGGRTISQLVAMIEAIDRIIERPETGASRPVYDRMNLVLAIKAAAENFRDFWLARLGKPSKQSLPKEHWTRVKALSRRFAEGWADEYDTLTPVADLRKQLQNGIYVMLQNPVDWVGAAPSEDEQQSMYEGLANNLTAKILALSSRRLGQERIASWWDAYSQRGTGSTFERASIIADDIYDKAAPIPDVTPSPDQNKFLHEVVQAVEQVAAETGARLQ